MTLFRQTSKISTKTIKYLLELDWMSDENEIFLGKILKMKNDQILQTTGSALTEIELDELYKVGGRLDGPAAMLFESSYVGKYNDEIIFIKKEYMMRKSKWIVLSATANQELYANYFKGEEICFQKVHQAKYKGSVIQRTAYPMSRRFINLNEKDKIIEGIEKILKNDIPLISFKMLFPDSQIHFGKTEGFDEYSGKDIAVVGTPHNAPILYKLVGEVLGYGVAEKMAVRRIEKNEYSFPFMTFGSEDMQNLQTFFIETELEQAIGRARILRNDCTVYVFSNYPVQQAELIQEPYLELQDIADENEDVEEY